MTRHTIPYPLIDIPQWVAADPDKVPHDPKTGRRASPTDPATWGTFEQACALADRRGWAVGLVLTKAAGIVAVDLDGCRDPETGRLEPWAAEIVNDLDTYAEDSVSGTGVHCYARGSLPPGGRKHGQVELYDDARYIIVTGRRISRTGVPVERTTKLARLHRRVFGKSTPATESSPIGDDSPARDDDEAVLDRAFAARNGDKVRRLFAGDTAEHGGDHSAADLALVSELCFWTADDAQVDRLFRRSGLMREKWDQRRGASTYAERTLAKARTTQPGPSRTPRTDATLRLPEDATRRTNIRAFPSDPLLPHVPLGPNDAPDPAALHPRVPDEADLPDHPDVLKALLIDECRRRLELEREHAELRAKIADLTRERDAARADVSTLVYAILNPEVKHAELIGAASIAAQLLAKQAKGEIEPDGTVALTAAEIADDWRPAPATGERVAPTNPSGTRPRMARDRVGPFVASAVERGLVRAKPRSVHRTAGDGSRYKDTEWVFDPVPSIAAALNPWACYRPAEPTVRKPRTVAQACPSCGEVHPIARRDYCGGCGALQREVIVPVADIAAGGTGASNNLSEAQTPTVPSPPTRGNGELSDKRSEAAARADLLARRRRSTLPEPAWLADAPPIDGSTVAGAWLNGRPLPGFDPPPLDHRTDVAFGRRGP